MNHHVLHLTNEALRGKSLRRALSMIAHQCTTEFALRDVILLLKMNLLIFQF